MIKFIFKVFIIILIIYRLLPYFNKFISNLEFKLYKKKREKRLKDKDKKKKKKYKSPVVKMSLYFGLPGSGKTTYLTYLCKKYDKLGIPIYTNCLDIDYDLFDNVKYIPFSYIGKVDIDNSILLLDEMGLEMDNRDYKNNFKDKSLLQFVKLFRHRSVKVVLISQTTDVDKKLRDLCEDYYLVRRSIIPFFTCLVPISKKVGIDEHSRQLIDAFDFPNFFTRLFTKKYRKKLIYQPLNWKYFNSWACEPLPSISDYEKETKQMLSKLPFNKKVQTG